MKETAPHHAYLKWPRIIVFNLNGALAITATALCCQALNNLAHDKNTLSSQVPGAYIHAGDAVAVGACMTTAAGIASVYTAVLGTVVTLGLHKEETKRTLMVKEVMMVFMACFLFASTVAATVILSTRSARLSAPGLPESLLVSLVEGTGKSIKYTDTLTFPGMIVSWCCFGTTTISFILATLAHKHVAKYGPSNTLVGHSVSNGYENGTQLNEKPAVSHTSHV